MFYCLPALCDVLLLDYFVISVLQNKFSQVAFCLESNQSNQCVHFHSLHSEEVVDPKPYFLHPGLSFLASADRRRTTLEKEAPERSRPIGFLQRMPHR